MASFPRSDATATGSCSLLFSSERLDLTYFLSSTESDFHRLLINSHLLNYRILIKRLNISWWSDPIQRLASTSQVANPKASFDQGVLVRQLTSTWNGDPLPHHSCARSDLKTITPDKSEQIRRVYPVLWIFSLTPKKVVLHSLPPTPPLATPAQRATVGQLGSLLQSDPL